MKKSLIAVALLTLTASMAYASEPQMRPDSTSRLVERVDNLTDQQKQQIAKIRARTLEENAEFFETAEKTKDDLQAAREANDQTKVDSIKQMIDSQKEQLKEIRESELKTILSAVLTREQRAQFAELRAAREAHKKEQQASHQ